ncbi:MAG: hypothetical protein R3C19_13840 [Planctomycetaceae bacterium]
MLRLSYTLVLSGLLLAGSPTFADDSSIVDMRNKAFQFLKLTQNADGSWTSDKMVGITGLVTAALLNSGRPVDDPQVAAGLKHLESHIKPDGGIYAVGSLHRNYETCITVLAFSAANKDGRYADAISHAEEFLKGLQWDQGEGIESSDPAWEAAVTVLTSVPTCPTRSIWLKH